VHAHQRVHTAQLRQIRLYPRQAQLQCCRRNIRIGVEFQNAFVIGLCARQHPEFHHADRTLGQFLEIPVTQILTGLHRQRGDIFGGHRSKCPELLVNIIVNVLHRPTRIIHRRDQQFDQIRSSVKIVGGFLQSRNVSVDLNLGFLEIRRCPQVVRQPTDIGKLAGDCGGLGLDQQARSLLPVAFGSAGEARPGQNLYGRLGQCSLVGRGFRQEAPPAEYGRLLGQPMGLSIGIDLDKINQNSLEFPTVFSGAKSFDSVFHGPFQQCDLQLTVAFG
jgi:hypothetical protein